MDVECCRMLSRHFVREPGNSTLHFAFFSIFALFAFYLGLSSSLLISLTVIAWASWSHRNARKWKAHCRIYLHCMPAAFWIQICIWTTSTQQMVGRDALLLSGAATQRTCCDPASEHIYGNAANVKLIPWFRWQRSLAILRQLRKLLDTPCINNKRCIKI